MNRKTFAPKMTPTNIKNLADSAPARDKNALLIDINTIKLGHNPRSDLGDLTELKASISEHGILTPLLVAQGPDGLELLAGHRRLECAKLMALSHVPCRVIEAEKPEVIKLLDNTMRSDLAPIDLCLAVKMLLLSFGGNQSALARAISKSPSYVNRAVRTASLIEDGVLCARAQSNLSLRALFDLASIDAPQKVLGVSEKESSDAIRNAKRKLIPDKKSGRQPSGALPGGRSVAQAITLKETKGGTAFHLSVHYDQVKTAPETKAEIIRYLQKIIEKLKKGA